MTEEFRVVDEPALSSDESRQILRRTWRRLHPYRRAIVFTAIVVVMQAAMMLAGPAIVRFGLDEGVREGDGGRLNLAVILYVITAALAYVFGRITIVMVGRIGEGFLKELRNTVFQHQMRMSMDFFDRNRTGTLVSRMTADIEALQELVSQGLSVFIVNILIFFGAFVVMALMSWQLTLIVLVSMPFVIVASAWFRRESNRAYLALRDQVGWTLTSLQEGLAGVRVVQAFAQEDPTQNRFEEINERQFEAHLETERIAAWYFPVIEVAQGFSIAAVLVVGGWLTTEQAVTLGTVVAFVLYLQNLFEPIQELGHLLNTVQASGAALQKLYGLLDEDPSISDAPDAVETPARGALVVDDVTFAYGGGDPVLRNVSISVAPGERLALVGPTGSGKSTLAKLMARLYDPTSGSVSYGEVDLRAATMRSVRERIVVVPQEGFLFDGTIRDNLLVGDASADDERLWGAVSDLALGDRFDAFPAGLDTIVHERGSNFSAGEKQLISIVRAALADPEVVVLDEATSSLDPGTELALERALERFTAGRTSIVVAHRLTTAERSDAVAVVQNGVLVEHGPHAELVNGEGPYAALYASWIGGLGGGT
jgi:ATP-binding cassette subfamily B protein